MKYNSIKPITPDYLEIIYSLASKGKTDTYISKEIGVSVDKIARLTTKYWRDKMCAAGLIK